MKKRNTIAISLLSLFLLAGCNNHKSDSNITGSSDKSDKTSMNSSESNKSNHSTAGSSTSTTTSKTDTTEKLLPHPITIDAEGVTLNGIPNEAKKGDKISFTAQLEEEKVLSYITIDGVNVLEADEEGTYSFVMPDNALTVTAKTEDKLYNINVAQIPGATIAVSTTKAKKLELVTVRVTIGDETKTSPIVKADDDEVMMHAVDGSAKTFEGSFINTGKDMDVVVTLSDAPAKFSITDKAGDGAIVSGPTAASKGESVNFRIGLEAGYEFDGEVVITRDGKTEEEANVEYTKNEDGSYTFIMPDGPVTITRKTTASIFKINPRIVDGEEFETTDTKHKLTLKDNVSVADYSIYKDKVSVTVNGNDYYDIDKIEANGILATLNEETGKYEFEMPSSSVDLKITTKARRYKINLVNSDHVTLKAYLKTLDENGAATYTEAPLAGVRKTDQVYIKATLTDEDNYGIKTISVQRGSGNALTLGTEDGYYTDKDFCVPDRKENDTLTFTVEEGNVVLKAGDVLLGKKAGVAYSSYGNDRLSTTKTLDLSSTGYGTLNHQSIYLNDYNSTSDDFILTNGTYYYPGKKLSTDLIYVNEYSAYSVTTAKQNQATSLNQIDFFIDGVDTITKKNIVYSDDYSATVRSYVAEIGDDQKSKFVYLKLTKASLYGSFYNVDAKAVTVEVKNGKDSFSTDGAIFSVSDGANTLYFENKKGKLNDYVKGEEKTITGKFGSIKVDGFGSAVLTKEDGTEENGSYTSLGGSALKFTFGEASYNLMVKEDNTYTPINYGVGTFRGARLSSTDSFANMILNDSFQGDFRTNSAIYSASKDIHVLDSGALEFGSSEPFWVSPDGKDAIYQYSPSMVYFLSTKIDEMALSHCNLQVLNAKTGNNLVATMNNPSTGAKDSSYSSVYYDGTNYIWGTINTPETIKTDGTEFTFTTTDNEVINMKNENGKLTIVESAVKEEYENETTGKLVLNGDGTGTMGDKTITYTKKEDGTIEVVEGENTYTVTLDTAAKTYTAVKKEAVVIPEWLKGKTFKGSVSITYEDEEYGSTSEEKDMFFVFSDKEMTLSTSAGYGASKTSPLGGSNAKNTNVAYTIEGTKLSVTLNGKAVLFTIDEEKKIFTPDERYEIDDTVIFLATGFSAIA